MSWADRYRRQAHIALLNHEATGLSFFYHAAEIYRALAEEAEKPRKRDAGPGSGEE